VKLPNWVLWRWVLRKGKWDKPPYQPDGAFAQNNNSKTWSSYETVLVAVDKFEGIGFCLLGSEFAAFDIDDCRDPATGNIHPWATDLVNKVGSYTEITVSGTGLRIIGYGAGSEVHNKRPVKDGVSLEIYRQATRYIVITGNPLPGYDRPLVNIDAHIDAVVAELDGKKQKKKPTAATNGELPRSLLLKLAAQGAKPAGYPSRSELFYAFICEALRLGIDENAIVAAALDEAYAGNSIYEHVQENHGEEYVRRQIERAVNEQHTDEKGRTIIVVPEGDTDATWRATQKALITHNSPVYVRNNRLVEPL
jgi:hypothetical protein